MNHKNLTYIALITILLAPIGAVLALADDIDAVDRNGRIIESVTVDDDIYVSGVCSPAADDFVDVYVVKKRSSWKDENTLTDVTGTIERVKADGDGELELTRVWFSRLDVGDYDIVVDVDENGVFDEDLDCVDAGSGTGFSVISKGTGTVSEGSKNPDEDFEWQPEKHDPFVTFLQVRLRVDDQEDVRIEGIELSPRGSGNDRNSVLEVIIAEDRDSNGKYEDGRDRIWAVGKYDHDNRKKTIATDVVLEKKDSVNLVIAYLMGKGLRNSQEFSVSVTDIKATGLLSNGEVRFSGLPIASVEMEVEGSGDATPVRREADVPIAQDGDTGNNTRPPSSQAVANVVGESEENLLGSLFSSESVSAAVGDGLWAPTWLPPWVPPLTPRNIAIAVFGLIGLIIVWKLLRGLFRMITYSKD